MDEIKYLLGVYTMTLVLSIIIMSKNRINTCWSIDETNGLIFI